MIIIVLSCLPVCVCVWGLQPAYLVQVDAFARGNASPCRCRLGAPQDCQQLVVPVLLDIMAASILRLMASPVRCHPDLQAAYSLLSMVELLRTTQTAVMKPWQGDLACSILSSNVWGA